VLEEDAARAEEAERAKERAKEGGGAEAEEKEETPLQKQARELFKKLCGKLDAMSHFHFTPKPFVEDMEVRPDLPAVAIEEVGANPQSSAQLKAPQEVFKGGDGRGGVRGSAAGQVADDGELTKSDRKRIRAKKKRKVKKVLEAKAEKDVLKKRRMERDQAEQRAAGVDIMPAAQLRKSGERSEFAKSSKVFARLQELKEQEAAGKEAKKGKRAGGAAAAPVYKL